MEERNVTIRSQKIEKDFTKQKVLLFGMMVGCLLLVAAFAPHLTPYDPYIQDLENSLKPPSANHLMGTDLYGRDMFSRVIMGSQTTIFATLFLVAIVSVVGSAIGVLCGYHGGRLDSILMRFSDVFLSFPGMVFAIAVASVMRGGLISAIIALSCISWPKYARIARSQVMMIKNTTYIAAAKLAGSSTGKIIFKHVLPNIVSTIIITAVLDIGTMMMEIAGLSFLGLGASPPVAEWGSMMSNGRSMIQTAPWTIMGTGLAIFLTVMVFNLFGDAVRDVLDPRQKKGKW
ncbi:nickel transporter permease [Fusibacter ferrireducens]